MIYMQFELKLNDDLWILVSSRPRPRPHRRRSPAPSRRRHQLAEPLVLIFFKVIFRKGPGRQSFPNDANRTRTHVEKETYILGATLL